MTADQVADVVAEDLDQPRQFEAEGFFDAPSRTNQERGYWFTRGFIHSHVGTSAPVVMLPDAASYMLSVLEHDADHCPEPTWRALAASYANHLAQAIDEHRAYWAGLLEAAE